ncbi:MAG: cysteine synthase A [Candidatus Nealsonbacteria bacterium CG_4_9_14_0_2_um_filter_37_38]|uniref:Cysteine synthase n=1 Tax=Candidatus Nealsonbacteria bacterium CG_4_10_14_0_8_um_filter_37_14 TaxID=1974684 RepID=A0A2M7R731_9BACT|nr:MAG: cysteine synthase A [Candidatus Nealsonbacteria bacterium CG11_big_fil_rev_8_21_14_0_20_37_68]PIW92299.1 MAG: cysteine synthase A [Candidatus Nealsonbacteria bacterium CG_4_8_14_3_um_filter_37_23]PIY89626.1 MAG: cysteine synthase A [Candidatus Nealsonbacteria bacterium CG_4_10_14_0_8_um_filter_37_14]PJC51875.1 MAG: cysteine synthase A [Candidatus Nealsonbacteria bacterium CG_4_9_14_0_2_um_filter_37_38]
MTISQFKKNKQPKRKDQYTEDIFNTIGHTPLIKIGKILAKLETTNPTGSVKDRMAWYMIRKAEERGELKPGDTIIEVTSGNTGISFAMISTIRGFRFIAVMPGSMSIERQKMMKAFGAKIILTPAREDMAGAIRKYGALVKKNRDAWLPRQFENPDNIAAHREGLGKEIIKQTNGKIDAFVAGVGTGGTLIGVGQALKEMSLKIKVIAVEPAESAVLSGKKPGSHQIQGIGEGFVPKLVKENMGLIDEVIAIKSQDAIEMTRKLAKNYGVLVGTSSGANVLASMKISKRYKNVVTVLPDGGERYLSEGFI